MTNRRTSSRRRTRAEKPVNPWREFVEWVLCIVIAVGASLAFHTFVAQLVIVDGDSMEPTLYDRELVLMTKYSYKVGKPQRGDIIVTHYPIDREYYVKRVIGLPGEVVEVRDGVLTIDGRVLDEPYIREPMWSDFGPYTVEADHVLVMGDNRNISLDSRSELIGTLAIDAILGKVRAVLWPPRSIGGIGEYSGVLAAPAG